MLENPKLLSVIIETVGGRHWDHILNYFKNGGLVVYFGIIGEYAAPKKLSDSFALDWTFSAYTRHEYELTSVGKEILGEALTTVEYSKANLLKVPESDRILVPKHPYDSLEDLVRDEIDGRQKDDDEVMDEGRVQYAAMREELNKQALLVMHEADHGGRIAYLGFVNGNIPKFVKAICMGARTSSMS